MPVHRPVIGEDEVGAVGVDAPPAHARVEIARTAAVNLEAVNLSSPISVLEG